MVGDTERDAATDQRVGDGRGGRVALVGGGAHPLAVDRQRVQHPRQHAQRRLEHGDRVEQRRLVLLEVALVGQRQALEHGQHRGLRADDAGGAATDQLGGVRVLLVGHDRRPGRERVARQDEPEPRVRPPRDLLGQPAEVDHPERDRPERLDHEVAVAHRVERVRGDAIEAELVGRRLPIQRIARAGQRAGTERRDVRPTSDVGQSIAVALGHLDVGQQVVGEQHGLGRLDVRRPGQDRRALALRQRDQRALEIEQRAIESIDRPAKPEPEVGRHLVVPRAAGVELAGHRADPIRQRRLEVEVDVLERRIPLDGAVAHGICEALQPADQLVDLLGRQQSRPAEPVDVGDRSRDVVGSQLAIDVDRAREVGHALIVLLAEPSAPEPHAPLRRVPGY